MQGELVQVSPDTVVTSSSVLLPSLVSANSAPGSMVAVRLRSSGAPRLTRSVTVIVVSPLAGRSPSQSITPETGAPQLKPLLPSAPIRVTPVGGSVTATFTPLAG